MRSGRNAARTAWSIPIAASVIAAVLLGPTAPRAIAEPTCSYDPDTLWLTVTLAPGDPVTLSVGEGNTILVDGRACATLVGGEQPAITVAVEVGDVPADETVTVSQAGPGGRFPDGYRIRANLGPGGSDRVAVVGDDQAETFGFTGSGMYGPLEVFPIGVELFELDTGGGNDTVDANGSDVDTGSFNLPLTIRGGPGNDTLTGGPREDRVLGDDGDDTLDGGPGIDRLSGGEGTDTCLLDQVVMPCDPSIGAEPPTVLPAEPLTLAGTGWYPENGAVELSLVRPDGSTEPLTTVAPDEGWSIEAAVEAPSPSGAYSVLACQCSDREAERATRALTVGPAGVGPTLLVLPSTVAVGASIVVSGDGWDPEAGPISLFAALPDIAAGEAFATVSASADGRFAQRFRVPELEENVYEVAACQRCQAPDAVLATTTFTVQGGGVAAATLELRPPQGDVGDRLEVVGAGWDPDAGRVRIFLDPSGSTSAPVSLVRPGGDGGFVVSLEVPDLEAGSHTVLACQRCEGRARIEAAVPFTVRSSAAVPWWPVALGAALLIGAIGGLVARRARARRARPPDRIRVRLRHEQPEVHLVPDPDGSPRHTVRLTPRGDPGVQRIRERSSR